MYSKSDLAHEYWDQLSFKKETEKTLLKLKVNTFDSAMSLSM